MSDAALLERLASIVGANAVRTDDAALALAASDVHITGERPLAVVRPGDAAALAAAVAATTAQGVAVLPRGGGLSYTGGYARAISRCTIATRRASRLISSPKTG